MADRLTDDVAVCPARQHLADRGDPCGAHHHTRPDLGRAFQSGGDAGLCPQAGNRGERRTGLCRWRKSQAALPGRFWRTPCSSCRSCRYRRRPEREADNGSRKLVATFGLVFTILGRSSLPFGCNSLAGRALHHRSLLVHRVDVLRQSGGRRRAGLFQHLRGHPSRSTCPASSSPNFWARCLPWPWQAGCSLIPNQCIQMKAAE